MISTILAIITSIPQIIKVVELIKPIKAKVQEVEADFKKKVKPLTVTKDQINQDKHEIVSKWINLHILPNIRKYDFDEYDMDTMIRFVVLFIRKVKKLRRFK